MIVAAMWGPSNQLATDPVAVVSLLTASSTSTLAAPGTDDFIALALMLTLMVAVIQLVLGVFKLGVVVNFLSHPVIVGFTNAAAIIIGLSQLSKLLIVLITLLFLITLLYHLPQAVLAAVIIMAVGGLVNIEAMKHAWKTHKHDGVAPIVTFVAAILFAPNLDMGILVGAGLAILLFLLRTMKPRVALLGRYSDGTLRDIKVNPDLPTSPHVMAMRFDGWLCFANVSYFEDAVLEALAERPSTRVVLIVRDAINQLDASDEEILHHVVERLHAAGIMLVFLGLKRQIIGVMRQTGLIKALGEDNLFATGSQAITAIYQRPGESAKGDLFRPVKPEAA